MRSGLTSLPCTMDRLTALDNSCLYIENDSAYMHVAGCLVFEGPPPEYGEFVQHFASRLHRVRRYRQRLAFLPFGQVRLVWIDDPHFNLTYHVSHTALPRPGDDEQLKRLAGRVFSQPHDRSRPLWEMWLVDGMNDNRFTLLSKTHHALIDGVSSVDLATVLFDSSPHPVPVVPLEHDWIPRPGPSDVQLLASALLEPPRELVRGVRTVLRGPRAFAGRLREALAGVGAQARAGLQPAPPSPFNVGIGRHRRFTWVRGDLAEFKMIKNAVGGTVNDVILAVVADALGRYMRLHGERTDGVVLKAMVSVSTRADIEQGVLGNRVSAMWAPLPVGKTNPVARLHAVSAATTDLKDSGQAAGVDVLVRLTALAPTTIMAQAARLQAHQRMFNLVVTKACR